MKNVEKVGGTGIFTKFIYKALPLAFDESLSYYECLCALLDYLENTVIPALNNNADAIVELQELYNELKEYVDNYFKNLDIQTEINNKLDEMAESGQLADIIAQYLQVASVLGFDTKASLKSAENLAEGSIARTLGTVTYDDGKGNYYKIRTITSGDVIDDDNILALANYPTYIAEKMPDYNINLLSNAVEDIEENIDILSTEYVNVKKYGAVGDGTTDDYTAIQTAIDENPLKTIFIPEGEYLISNYIKIYGDNDHFINLKLDSNAIIKTNNNLDQLILIGDWSKGSYDRWEIINHIIIEGGNLDCTNVTRGIFTEVPLTKINKVNFTNISNYGLIVGVASNSSDTKVNGCNFSGTGSSTTDTCTAIRVNGNDNEFNHIRIDGTKVGIDIDGGGNFFNDIHMTAVYHNNYDYYNDTKAFDISSGSNIFNLCYADTYHIGFNVTSNNANFFTNCFTYWYYSTENTSAICFNVTGSYPRLHIANSNLTLPSTGTNHVINLTDRYAVKNLNMNNSVKLINNNYTHNSTVSDIDTAFEMNVNKENGCQLFWSDATLSANNYYYIGTIKESNSLYSFDISANNQFRTHLILKYTPNSASLKSKNVFLNENSYTYTLLLGDQFTVNNNSYVKMYLKCSNNISSNVSITNVNKCGENSIFTKIGNSTSVTPSTTLTTLAIS